MYLPVKNFYQAFSLLSLAFLLRSVTVSAAIYSAVRIAHFADASLISSLVTISFADFTSFYKNQGFSVVSFGK